MFFELFILLNSTPLVSLIYFTLVQSELLIENPKFCFVESLYIWLLNVMMNLNKSPIRSQLRSPKFVTEEGRRIRDSVVNVVEVEILGLQSRIEKHEHQLHLRLGNIESAISQIQQKLEIKPVAPNSSTVGLTVENVKDTSRSSSIASSRRGSLRESASEWMLFHGMDLKLSDSQAEVEKKFNLFLRENLGFSWEAIRGISAPELICLEGDINGQKSSQLFVRFESGSDVELIKSRAPMAEIQGYEISEVTSAGSKSGRKTSKKVKRSLTGWGFIVYKLFFLIFTMGYTIED